MGSLPPRGSASKLFTPLPICNGTITLSHRVIVAPMTRNRGVPLHESTPENPNRIWIADELVAKYYSQRATPGGLLITESIMPSPEAGAMPGVPGLWLKEHGEGWKLVFLPSFLIPTGLRAIADQHHSQRPQKQSMKREESFSHNSLIMAVAHSQPSLQRPSSPPL